MTQQLSPGDFKSATRQIENTSLPGGEAFGCSHIFALDFWLFLVDLLRDAEHETPGERRGNSDRPDSSIGSLCKTPLSLFAVCLCHLGSVLLPLT